jgi:hypothetical protein
MIVVVILMLIAGLLMKRMVTPLHTPQRAPLSAGMGG